MCLAAAPPDQSESIKKKKNTSLKFETGFYLQLYSRCYITLDNVNYYSCLFLDGIKMACQINMTYLKVLKNV